MTNSNFLLSQNGNLRRFIQETFFDLIVGKTELSDEKVFLKMAKIVDGKKGGDWKPEPLSKSTRRYLYEKG